MVQEAAWRSTKSANTLHRLTRKCSKMSIACWLDEPVSDCLRDNLNGIGTISYLREEEEVQLGKIVRVWWDFENIASVKQRRGRRAFIRMVNGNLRLVLSIVNQYGFRIKGNSTDMMDLVQAGYLSLMRAVEKFDPSRGYRLSTYGYWWIKQSTLRYIQDHNYGIRIPRSLALLTSRVDHPKQLEDNRTICRPIRTE